MRAVVRTLSDEQLVVVQGVENTARKDLSYIEKALFAHGLELKGFSRDIIGQAVSLDKGELSKLISVAKRVPDDLIRKIGAAPAAGRRRWQELADLLEDNKQSEKAYTLSSDPKFRELSTDDRFITLLKALTPRPEKLVHHQNHGDHKIIVQPSALPTGRRRSLSSYPTLVEFYSENGYRTISIYSMRILNVPAS